MNKLTPMNDLIELKRELKEVKSMLRQALPSIKKETWVGVSVVQELTGWSGREKMRWARENNLVVFNKTKGYLLESIPPVFIQNQSK